MSNEHVQNVESSTEVLVWSNRQPGPARHLGMHWDNAPTVESKALLDYITLVGVALLCIIFSSYYNVTTSVLFLGIPLT